MSFSCLAGPHLFIGPTSSKSGQHKTHAWTTTYPEPFPCKENMSSPNSSRRSARGTPRRSSQRGSQAPPSDNEQNGSSPQQNTPRASAQQLSSQSQSQQQPTSSPLFFNSSPAGSQSQSQSQSLSAPNGNRVNISSPLRQRADEGINSEDARTPRAGVGGKSTARD